MFKHTFTLSVTQNLYNDVYSVLKLVFIFNVIIELYFENHVLEKESIELLKCITCYVYFLDDH